MKKNCIKLVKKKFRIEKVIKRKGYKLRLNNSFDSWINKKDLV